MIRLPTYDENLAEFIGIMLGDGNIYINQDVAQVTVTCHLKKESDYIENFLEPLIKKIFAVKSKITHREKDNSIVLRINSKILTRILMLYGLREGNKIKNQVDIPSWIRNNDIFLRACLRGLIDTDGSIYRLTPHWPNLFQLSFKNNNKNLLRDTRKAFVRLGYNPSKIFGNRIVLTRQSEIYKYFKEIGSHNIHTIENSPVV